AADLTLTARTACVEEGRQIRTHGRRMIMDVTRFAQFGKWEGEITYDGRTVPIDASRVHGTKDRSWGVRGVGIPDTGLAPTPQRVVSATCGDRVGSGGLEQIAFGPHARCGFKEFRDPA